MRRPLLSALLICALAALVGMAWMVVATVVWPIIELPLWGGLVLAVVLAAVRMRQLRAWTWAVVPAALLSALFGTVILGFPAHCIVRLEFQGYEYCT